MITSRLPMTKGSGATIKPPPGTRPSRPMAASISAGSWTGAAVISTRQTRRNGSKFPEIDLKIRSDVRIEHEAGPDNARRDLLEQLQPFADHFKIDKGKPSNVAARMCQARDEGQAHRIVNHHKDDGDGTGWPASARRRLARYERRSDLAPMPAAP